MWVVVGRKPVLALLALTVLAPIVLYTDRLATYTGSSASNAEFIEESPLRSVGVDSDRNSEKLNALPQEPQDSIKEPAGVVYADNSTTAALQPLDLPKEEPVPALSDDEQIPLPKEQEVTLGASGEHKSRVLSAADEAANLPVKEPVIRQVTGENGAQIGNPELQKTEQQEQKQQQPRENTHLEQNPQRNVDSSKPSHRQERKPRRHSERKSVQASRNEPAKIPDRNNLDRPIPDTRVRQLRDQLIQAKVYLGLSSTRSDPHFIRELRLRIKDVQKAVGDATKDSDLPRNANDKMKAMEQILARGKQIQDDCSAVIKKLRAMLHSTEEQLRVHKKQALFLTQLAAKTLPKGLHCLPLRLSTEYYALERSKQEFPNQEKLEDPKLHHYALFSDNILAAAVVVNSTITHAKVPEDHVFHIVTDRLNYAAMRMWFLANPPGKATIEVQNIDDFTWLNASYSPVLRQLGSQAMIDYYFRTHRANSDPNLKYRNPKYLSILNHLRFYLPEIFPKLDKVVFLDDDIVVQKDMTGLWRLDLKGKVNGAVETCGENFHRFDRYLNFSNPIIAKNFDPKACGWAYGMNVFDLAEWKRQNITGVYHSWQNLNQDRLLWKLGTLPPGLITFWKRTFPLEKSWHVLGLGYNPSVGQKDIEQAAVIHYNGNMKPWLEIGIPKFRNYWAKYLDYDQPYLRDCNINP